MTLVTTLTNKGLMTPPDFVQNQTVYETKMGSQAYGCSEDQSDLDVYAFCMPPLHQVFPHLRGEFPGFGSNEKPFEVFQQHKMVDDFEYKEFCKKLGLDHTEVKKEDILAELMLRNIEF